MSRPRLLDLFCCAGGAGMGYHQAGFDVVGVDIRPQPRYPFEFIQADCLTFDPGWIACSFDAVHASPPCQAYTKAQRLQKQNHPDLIAPVREIVRTSQLPYVIENVPGAPLVAPVELCGSMFPGLMVYRHRLFECSFFMLAPPHPVHDKPQVKMGRKPAEGDFIQPVGNFSGAEYARQAMETPWMARDEMSEAIPPAYTRFIGEQLMHHIEADRRAEAA